MMCVFYCAEWGEEGLQGSCPYANAELFNAYKRLNTE